MNGADIIAIIILATIVIAIVVYLLHWLYRHSSKDLSFVRTGLRRRESGDGRRRAGAADRP